MKALTFASRSPDQHETLGTTFDEDSAVFFMEQLVTVAMENKLVKCMLTNVCIYNVSESDALVFVANRFVMDRANNIAFLAVARH